MTKTKQKFKPQVLDSRKFDEWLSAFKFKDLQRQCVIRSMTFEDVISVGWHGLANYLYTHQETEVDETLLDDFDDWLDEKLKERGFPANSPFRSKFLRLGFIAEYDENGEIKEAKKPRIRGVAKASYKKRERDNKFGIFKGTKKALTYECVNAGKSLEETTEIVSSKFPEAKEKSIRIWYNKCKKAQSQKN